MSRRGLGWLALLLWIGVAIEIDMLRDLPALVARHHAGFLAPFAEYILASIVLIAAIFSTVLWRGADKTQVTK